MSMFKYYIRKALSTPPRVTAKKVAGRVKQKALASFLKLKDHLAMSFVEQWPECRLYQFFPRFSPKLLFLQVESIGEMTRHYLDHRFDLLGSGWVRVHHGIQCRGLEGYRYSMREAVEVDPDGKWLQGRINRSNVGESRRIWRLIFQISPGNANPQRKNRYIPIDWHIDFKSGFRWKESIWYRDIRYGHKQGVDVKVPWELARMQHLVQLAFAFALVKQNTTKQWIPSSDLAGQANMKFFRHQRRMVDKTENLDNGKNHLETPEEYALEFRSQVLDFIANNPPRFGVNWKCTMDVGIRIANWLVAYDLFRAYGANFDGEFNKVFLRSVYEHGLHIINNLEWGESIRSNHYLANITGLLFVASYLPCTPETDAWLAFAVQELIKEVALQFYQDGGNFEASTSYHRLAAEMVVYATALVLGLPYEKLQALKNYDHTMIKVKPGLAPSPLPHYRILKKNDSKAENLNQKLESPFPYWYFERLEKMAEFTMHITKPNNRIPQIGDNDSGRFFKFQPMYNKMTVAEAKKRYRNLEGYDDLPDDAIYWDEDFLDHRHLVAAINGLFDRKDFATFADKFTLETNIIKNLAGGICIASYKKADEPAAAEKVRIAASDNELGKLQRDLEAWPENQKQTIKIPLPNGATDNLKLYAYPDFGLYIYRSKRIYLCIRCGPVGQNGNGGHAHNDQLSIELNIDGKDVIVDPGTYLYTPLPKWRNYYRSVKAHFTPKVEGKEPGDLSRGLFAIRGKPQAHVLYFGEFGFFGKHHGYGFDVFRQIIFEDEKVIIKDFAPKGKLCQNLSKRIPFSPGYGVIENESDN